MTQLPRISSSELSGELEQHRRRGGRFMGILLRDGSVVLVDSLPQRPEIDDWGGLRVRYETSSRMVDVLIPLNDIAGTHPFSTPLPGVAYTDEFGFRGNSFIDLFCDNVIEHARAKDYLVASVKIKRLQEPPDEAMLPGAISFESSEILYYDSPYFAGLGGLTGAGASVPAGGAFFSWATSQRKRALRRLRGRVRPVNEMCGSGKRPQRLAGFVEFFNLSGLPEKQRAKYELHEDAGLPFVPAKLSARREAGSEWALVFFRNIWGPFPIGEQEAWERIDQPVRLYGEVVHRKITTESWVANCYMLVRCAGVVA